MTWPQRAFWFLGSLIVGITALSTCAHSAQVTMAWEFNAEQHPEGIFAVYKSPTCFEPYTVVQTQGLDTTPCPDTGKPCVIWTDTHVEEGHEYCWYIVGVNPHNIQGPPSNTLRYTVPGPIMTPQPRTLRQLQP